MKGGKMKKDLNYYMSLDYRIDITPIPKDEGGGFVASIPQLGKYAFIGGGETPIEALKDLEETKKEYFKEYIKKKIEIPEPEKPKREFRGDFLIRMPTFLHESLYAGAKENNVSLNQYINYLLTTCMTLDSLEKKIGELAQEVKQLSERISRVPDADIIDWKEPSPQPVDKPIIATGTANLSGWLNVGCASNVHVGHGGVAHGVVIGSDVSSIYLTHRTYEKKKNIDLIDPSTYQEE